MIKTVTVNIWGREFALPIEYDCYKGEVITKEQISAVENFISHNEYIEKAKINVELFCKEKVMADDENERKDNIFSYIMPDYLFIKRDDNYPRVAIMCKYRYDQEHGVAVVFSHDGKTTVGLQDIIL